MAIRMHERAGSCRQHVGWARTRHQKRRNPRASLRERDSRSTWCGSASTRRIGETATGEAVLLAQWGSPNGRAGTPVGEHRLAGIGDSTSDERIAAGEAIVRFGSVAFSGTMLRVGQVTPVCHTAVV